ncbi:MAG: hypothetical protein RIA64_01785 [Rhodospirillales bacterium]
MLIDESVFADWPPGAFIFNMASPAKVNAARLRRIAEDLATHSNQDHRWLGERVLDYLDDAPRGATLDRALGVEPLPFCRPWWDEDTRDNLVTQLAAHFPGKKLTVKAKASAAAARRYATDVWPRECGLSEPPEWREGSAQEICWRLHKAPGKWPLGWRQIYSVLQSRPVPIAKTEA